MKRKSELVRFLQRQIVTENKIVDLLSMSISEIGNTVIKGVLKGISLESAKHAEMYNLSLVLMTTVPKAIRQDKLDRQRGVMKKHTDMESELIEELTKVLPSVENEKVKLLLNSILMDKKRHLGLLRQILEITSIEETITAENWQDIWWDMIWKDVRGST